MRAKISISSANEMKEMEIHFNIVSFQQNHIKSIQMIPIYFIYAGLVIENEIIFLRMFDGCNLTQLERAVFFRIRFSVWLSKSNIQKFFQ